MHKSDVCQWGRFSVTQCVSIRTVPIDTFETAAHVFEDPYYIEMYDIDHSTVEDRYVAIGMVGKVLFVVFTERRKNIRLISARYATEDERRLYYAQDIYD